MDFYFITTDAALKKNPMQKTFDKGIYLWKLSYDKLFFLSVFNKAGDAFDYLTKHERGSEEYAICKAKLVNNNEMLLLLIVSTLSGGEIKVEDIDVFVDEINWISKE